MAHYRILGSTDEHTECQLCGKSDLKGTVALRDDDTGETVFYGSDCAARALGWGSGAGSGAKVRKVAATGNKRITAVHDATTRRGVPRKEAERIAREIPSKIVDRTSTSQLAAMITAYHQGGLTGAGKRRG